MKQIVVFIWACMSISFITTITSCVSKKEEKKLEFYYYPEKNVYYDVTNKSFLYSIDSARTWNTMSGDVTDETPLGKREVIYSANDSVWMDNESHRKQFAGTLYYINAKDSVNETVVVTERKVAKKVSKGRSTRKVTAEKERKQPVKDFFKKLFGKKNKND